MMFRELRESIQFGETQLLPIEYHELTASKLARGGKAITTRGTKVHEG